MFITPRTQRTQRRAKFTAATLLCIGSMCTLPSFAAVGQIDATVRPSEISLDGAAQLQITVHGDRSGPPQAPSVEGLTFTPVEQSSREESINGVTSSSVSQTYRVTASHAGTYTIPAIPFGRTHTQPLVLQVLPGGSAAPAVGAALPVPSMSASPSSAADSIRASAGRDAFVRIVLPKKQLYVGELLPIQLRAYFRSDLGVDLNGPPVLKSDAFTLSNLSTEPKQSQVSIDGVPYTVVTWYGGLEPVKDGNYSLPIELQVTTQTRQPTTLDQMPDLDSFFNGNGFDSSFFKDSSIASLFGKVVEKPMALESPAETINVLPLPAAGRPAGFSGAVGSFNVSSGVTGTKVTQGDPLTVTMRISGEGNFDRVNTAEVSANADWKTYRPGATFSPEDSVGLHGTKNFEQAVIPLKAGSVQLPGLEFSYFDPRQRQYVTRQTPPIDVEVAPGQRVANTATGSIPTTPVSDGVRTPRGEVRAPMVTSSAGAFVSSLVPMVDSPWFFVLPSVPLAVMAGGLLLIRRREQFANDPILSARAVADSELRLALTALDTACEERDAEALMRAARRVLQVRFGHLWEIPPEAVNLHEIQTRLGGGWGPVRELFSVTEEVAYGGARPVVGTLNRWRQVVLDILHRLEQI